MISQVQSVTTSVCAVSIRPDGICELRFVESYDVDIAQIKEINDGIQQITQGLDNVLLLSIPGRYGSVTREAREYDACSKHDNNVVALAMVLPAIHQKLLARIFFKMVTKPKYEYKFFRTEEDAVQWLLSHR